MHRQTRQEPQRSTTDTRINNSAYYFNSMKSSAPLIPFMKWPGGKRWFTQRHLNLLPEKFDRYFEPFLGSGAVYFSIQPKIAVISDRNEELINTYQAIKSDWHALVSLLQKHQKNHSTDYYYKIRAEKPRNLISKAARTIYLNRTCFNGIYRVNLNGEFNVPIGTKDKVLLDTDNFPAVASLLSGADILSKDFEEIIDMSSKGDFIFIDPPYTIKHNNNGFIKYNEHLFSWHDQIRLRDAIIRAKNRGALILMSNANHQCVHELYADIGDLFVLSRASLISGSINGRGTYTELFLKTY